METLEKRKEIIDNAIKQGVDFVLDDIDKLVVNETVKAYSSQIIESVNYLNKLLSTREGYSEFYFNRDYDKNIQWRYEDNVFKVIANCDNSEISKAINKKIDERMKFFYESLYRNKIKAREVEIRNFKDNGKAN